MLEEIRESYKLRAKSLNITKKSINELVFDYIENENSLDSDLYYSGIIAKYWGYIGRLYNKCNKNFDFERCYDIYLDTWSYVLKKRVWENPESSLYMDKSAPDKAFHMVLKRQLGLALAAENAYKRKGNFNTLSMDEMREAYSDSTEGLLFDIEATSEEDNYIELIDFIKNLFTKDIVYGIVVDNICFNSTSEFREERLSRELKKLNKSNYNYYNNIYGVEEKDYIKAINYIQTTPSNILVMKIKSLLYELRREKKGDRTFE